jgi:hypothetical protein
MAALGDLLDATFRSDPGTALVPYERLGAGDRELLAALLEQPGFYGVLRPTSWAGQSLKAVDQDTALLFLTLQQPGPLPAYVRRGDAEALRRDVTRLVLDGVLQVRDGDAFVGGPAAAAALGVAAPDAADGRLAELSLRAVRYGELLGLGDSSKLSARLYFFNREPASPAVRARLPNAGAVAAQLDWARDGWSGAPSSSGFGWFSWRRRDTPMPRHDEPTYKVYVSPAGVGIRDVVHAVGDVAADAGLPSFKAGGDLHGLLRPDKIVLYARDRTEATDVGARLATALAGVAAQGVPFSSQLDADGLVSWGVDPPRSRQPLSWQDSESWRVWVTNRLAAALVAAQREPPAEPPWRYALQRLELEGVELPGFTPGAEVVAGW